MANVSVSQENIHATAVAIDKDKNSQYAVKWAVENSNLNRNIVLVHVNTYQGSSTRMDYFPSLSLSLYIYKIFIKDHP